MTSTDEPEMMTQTPEEQVELRKLPVTVLLCRCKLLPESRRFLLICRTDVVELLFFSLQVSSCPSRCYAYLLLRQRLVK